MYFPIVDRVDSLEDRQKTFFSNCAKNKLKGSEKDEYESIRKEYQKVKSLICSKKDCVLIAFWRKNLTKDRLSDITRLSKTLVRRFS